MEYPEFKIDFVKRTIEIWEKLSNKTKYEVTLLINCLYGLIVIPTEYNYVFEDYEKYKEFFIKQLKQYASKWQKDKNNGQLVRCMKNALSHLNIDTESENGKIKYIKFKDKEVDADEFHTEIKFTVDNLKTFARKIADYFLENCIHK